MKKLSILAAVAAVAVLGLTACSGGGSSSSSSPVGVWGEVDVQGQPSLEFMEDGSYSGSDGCNRLMGGWTSLDDGTINLEPMASTRMACEGVDDWLNQASSAEVQGSTLTIFDSSNAEIGTLARQ